MPEHLKPPPPPIGPGSSDDDHDSLRIRSRTPKPYRRLNSELLEPSDRIRYRPPPGSADDGHYEAGYPGSLSTDAFPLFARDSPHTSESGTEADDEHFLKGLPAPRSRQRKGLRGTNEVLSGASTPLLSPALADEEARKAGDAEHERDRKRAAERARRRRELVRRATEVALLVCQAQMVASNPEARPFLRLYRKELLAVAGLCCSLAVAYPLRLITWAYRQGKPSKAIPIRIPATFDPAPLLYPPLIPILVSLLLARHVKGAIVPSLVLSLCALPRPLIPGARSWEHISSTHWVLSCIPVTLDLFISATEPLGRGEIARENLVLLYPLHQTLCLILHHLTTTSLLISELQLLSTALISLLLLASSPQAVILKAVLWGGGLGLLVSCAHVIQYAISLARVPKWRFRRVAPSARGESAYHLLRQFLPLQRPRSWSLASLGSAGSDTDHSPDERPGGPGPMSPLPEFAEPHMQCVPRRHTLPATGKPLRRTNTTTPSGRRKRATSSSVRAFFSLTEGQAAVRKWLYAGYVYLCILLVILVGIRLYVQRHALSGSEPIGWALGYLFGDVPYFRFQVVKTSLERWIRLPPLPSASATAPDSAPCREHCAAGWMQHARLASFGAANTRLLLSGYWLLIIATGLAVVFRLSPFFEVDTRRKVFHFMMVAMFLPATYIDPCYVALALALMLAIFLLLDLLRASQLPPLSRPIARFLTPYVDGRDLRGPVVVSHIFLLIGCAIPLWLSLAALPRGGGGGGGGGEEQDNNTAAAAAPGGGWDVPTRDVSMVAGVVCVGLGDAAASLVGRRWGRRKWLWGGGKSLEGSAAFAGAVFVGLMAAAVWLRLGGWAVTGFSSSFPPLGASGMDALLSVLDWGRLWPWLRGEAPRIAACASLASLTEAVLTGGNDNVVVPVVLWGCVKSLGV